MSRNTLTLTTDLPETADVSALVTELLAIMPSQAASVTLTGREARWAMQTLGLGHLTTDRITIDLTPAPAPASAGRRDHDAE